MARATIEGSVDEIATALGMVQVRERRIGAAARRYRAAQMRRRVLRRAFDFIRHDPNEKTTVDCLAGALGGRLPITETLLASARQIIAEHDVVEKRQ